MKDVRVVLVDVNPKMVQAFRSSFEENAEVTVVSGSMLDQRVDAWVTPTNARGSMDGGLDAVIKKDLGASVEARVQKAIKESFGGTLPVGHATCVDSGRAVPRYLISTPTMFSSSENISDTLNVALACAAAFQAVHMQNARAAGSIASVALPGLGANTGQVPVEICADLMWTGYSLFRRRAFESFSAMRAALEEELGDLSVAAPGKSKGSSKVVDLGGKTAQKAAKKAAGQDFDDHDGEDDGQGDGSSGSDEDFDDHG